LLCLAVEDRVLIWATPMISFGCMPGACACATCILPEAWMVFGITKSKFVRIWVS